MNICVKAKNSVSSDSRAALTRFKLECAEEIGHLNYCKSLIIHYKGDVSCVQNGREGGR